MPRWRPSPHAERLAAAKKLVGLKQIAIAWFLTQYLVDKEARRRERLLRRLRAASRRPARSRTSSITARADKITFDFTFRQLAAAGKNLTCAAADPHRRRQADVRPRDRQADATPSSTQLETNNEWYRNAPWSAWNPATVAAEKKEKITFSITREKRVDRRRSSTSTRLTADGKLDIDVYFGWDYHSRVPPQALEGVLHAGSRTRASPRRSRAGTR